MLENREVKVLLNKHLDIHYEALKATDPEWLKYKEQIAFNSKTGPESA
jgi:DNA primase large subunit